MEFEPISLDGWQRREHYEHYLSHVPCTYSMTTRVDITRLRQQKESLYPAMLYALATVVNSRREFRMALDSQGRPGVFSVMHPSYTVFHPERETFSNLWTEYTPDYPAFAARYREDLDRYGSCPALEGKPGTPPNVFPVSMIPWASFTGFNLNLKKDFDYLIPIFTMGRFSVEGERTLLPLAVQVHHAVCDGFHVCRFLEDLQALLDRFPGQA